MHNVEYLAVSFGLVWGLLILYMVYIHGRLRSLEREFEASEDSESGRESPST